MPVNDLEAGGNISPELELALISLGKAQQDLVVVQKWQVAISHPSQFTISYSQFTIFIGVKR